MRHLSCLLISKQIAEFVFWVDVLYVMKAAKAEVVPRRTHTDLAMALIAHEVL